MQFYGYHGVHPEEKRLGQRFEIDLEAWTDLKLAGESDDLKNTVSYSELFALARDVVEGPPKNLIESVAETIAERTLATFSMIESVTIEIRKPSAPVRSGGLDHVGVMIQRHRADNSASIPHTVNRTDTESR
jgi:7,8-dihydroneopterin aldolase/epimerase/oxygenase